MRFAVDDETEVGARCVAAAFRGHSVMAVSVSGPSDRFTAESAASAAETIRRAAERLGAIFAGFS